MTKQGLIDDSVLSCMKTGIKPSEGEPVAKATGAIIHENQGVASQPQPRQPGFIERLITPPQDAMRYAQSMSDKLQDTPACASFRETILEAGKGSRYQGSTLNKIITAYEEAKTKGCLASSADSPNSQLKQQTTVASVSGKVGLDNSHPPSVPANHDTGFIVPLVFLAIGYWIGKKRRRAKENQGEAAVRKALSKNFTGPSYHLLNNITLPYLDGTTQIDHILVSRKGIFVIETKHYKGWIFADAKSSKWTQVLTKKIRNPFQNPLHQNHLHVKTLQKMLAFVPADAIHSMVVFTGEAKFKTPIPPDVFHLDGLVDELRKFQADVITESNLYLSVGLLECKRREISGKTDVEHVAYLNQKLGELQ